MRSGSSYEKRRSSGTTRRIVVTVVLLVLVCAIGAVGYEVWKLYHGIHQAPEAGQAGQPSAAPVSLKKYLNILVLGCDSRMKDDPGRSDSIMLVGVDTVTRKVKIMSIPRDTRVTIPGHGYGKINATTNKDVYTNGGIPLLKQTLERLLPGITINYYVRTNFPGFVKIIDALGGVTINVEEAMRYRAADTFINLKPGVQHLDGTKALEYARFRDDGIGDYGSWGGQEHGRVARQKKLIKALIAQTTSLRNAWRLPKVIDVVQEAVVTDMPASSMLRLGLTFKDATDKNVMTVSFPGIPKWVDGTSYVVPYTGPLKEKIAPLFKAPAAVTASPSAATGN